MSAIEKGIDRRWRSGQQINKRVTDASPRGTTGTQLPNAKERFRGGQAPEKGVTGPDPEKGIAVSNQRGSGQVRKLTVLVADDHPVVREGLIALINHRPDMELIAEGGNGREAVDKYFAQRPDVTLVDLRMPLMGGVEAAATICDKDPAARIVIISSYENEEDIYRALRAGALGYVLKDASVNELVECIRAVGSGKTWIPPHVAGKLAKRVADQELTRRESEVLRAVAAGKSNKEVGATFNISEATVKVHMTHILEKLKVGSRTEAINVGVRRGLVRLDEPLVA